MFLRPPHRKCQCYYLCGIKLGEKTILIKYCVFVLIGGKYAIMHCPPCRAPNLETAGADMRFVKGFVIVEAKLCQMPQTEVITFNWGIPPIFLVFPFQGILVLLNINQIKD